MALLSRAARFPLAAALGVALVLPAAPALAAGTQPTAVVQEGETQPFKAPIMAPSSLKSASGLYLPLDPESGVAAAKKKWGGYRLTSPRGARCMPTVGATTEHLGQDIATKSGAPIYAVAAGKVLRTKDGTSANSGYIVIQSTIAGKSYQVAYIHMWDADAFVKVGDTVKAGQQISTVGSSGPSTGPHLHLEVWTGSWMAQQLNVMGTPAALDPIAVLAAAGLNITAKASSVYRPATPSSCTYYARGTGVIRAGANDTSAVLATFAAGDTVASTPGAMMNSRLRVTYKGKTGYAAWGSFSPFYVAPAISTQAGLAGRVSTVTSNVNLRASAVSGAVRTVLPKNASVTATGRVVSGGTWREVKYTPAQGAALTGWVSAAYLKDAPTAPAKPATPATPAKPTTPAKPSTPSTPSANAITTQASLKGKASTTTVAKLKLRASAPSGAVRVLLPQGAKVVATGRITQKGAWREVKYTPAKGTAQTGWVSVSYLKDASSSVASKPTAPAVKPAAKKTKKTTANVWLRAAPKTGKGIVVMKKGSTVTLSGTTKKVGGATWYKVTLGGRTGWTSGAYLR